MLKYILINLLSDKFSFVNVVIISVSTVLIINEKYKRALLLLLLGGLITAIMETLLGI
jgi:hypothetical protein